MLKAKWMYQARFHVHLNTVFISFQKRSWDVSSDQGWAADTHHFGWSVLGLGGTVPCSMCIYGHVCMNRCLLHWDATVRRWPELSLAHPWFSTAWQRFFQQNLCIRRRQSNLWFPGLDVVHLLPVLHTCFHGPPLLRHPKEHSALWCMQFDMMMTTALNQVLVSSPCSCLRLAGDGSMSKVARIMKLILSASIPHSSFQENFAWKIAFAHLGACFW